MWGAVGANDQVSWGGVMGRRRPRTYAAEWLAWAQDEAERPHVPVRETELTLKVQRARYLPRIVVKKERAIVGRLYLGLNVLDVADQRDRRVIASSLEAAGYEVRPPIGGWNSPRPRWRVYVNAYMADAWTFGFGGGDPRYEDGTTFGVFYPESEALFCLSELWFEPGREIAAWHGFRVGDVVDQVPDDPEQTSKYQGLLEYPPPRIVDRNARAASRSRRSALKSPRPLSATSRQLVPGVVAGAADAVFAAEPLDPTAPTLAGDIGWGSRSLVFDGDELAALREATPPLELPAETPTALEWARGISRVHELGLTAFRLRTLAPRWWATLPWRDVAPEPALLGLLGADESDGAARSGQPHLVQAVVDWSIPQPQLPAEGANAHGRFLLAMGALAHAGLTAGSDRLATSECLVCRREHVPAAHELDTLLRLHTSSVCRVCAQAALLRETDLIPHPERDNAWVPFPWTAQREEAAHEALRALAADNGGPPSRRVLAASVPWTSTDDLVRQVLLRMPLPRDLEPGGAVPSWSTLLADAGVLGEGWRPSFGVHTVAADGHPCRSLFERYVDDWLFARGVVHTVEPPYPYDAQLNPNGMRADWAINGVLVEAAGLSARSDYAAKIARKRELADRHGLQLVIVVEDDLPDLEQVLRSALLP